MTRLHTAATMMKIFLFGKTEHIESEHSRSVTLLQYTQLHPLHTPDITTTRIQVLSDSDQHNRRIYCSSTSYRVYALGK